MANVTNDTNYYDFNALKHITQKNDDEAIKEVAKQFESLFLQIALKSMTNANETFKTDLYSRNDENFYNDMLVQQLSLSLAQSGGIGLADVMVRQLSHNTTSMKNIPDSKMLPMSAIGSMNEKVLPSLPATNTNINVNLSATLSHESHNETLNSRGLDKVEKFIQSVQSHANRAADELGIDADVLIAQSALETGWGEKVLTHKNGESTHNHFGIKDATRHGVLTKTKEFVNRIETQIQDKFKSYQSVSDSFNDFVNLMKTKRYEASLNQMNPKHFLDNIKKAGYATDPEYSEKVMKLYSIIKQKRDLI